jgi:uncharacterized protein (TIGR03067 family)
MVHRRKGVRIAALTLALGLSACATAEMAALDGDWAGVQVLREGKPVPTLTGHFIQFESDHFQIAREGKVLFGGRYSVDPAASPPEIDLYQTETKMLAGTWRGIYALQGDRLTICDNAYGMDKPRPKRFEDCDAPGYILFRFKRAK